MNRYDYGVILPIHIYMSNKEATWFRIGLFNPLEIFLPHYKGNKIPELLSFPFIAMPKIITSIDTFLPHPKPHLTRPARRAGLLYPCVS